MNRLSVDRRKQIVSALVEGNSIRATSRMTGASKNTVTKLIVDLGEACARHMDETMRNVASKRIQVDEIWAFCYAKEKNVPADFKGVFGYGDVWTFVAIDPDTKLVPSFHVGMRNADHATTFLTDLQERMSNRVQLTSDGHKMYLSAVESAFGCEIDYAMVQKHFAEPPRSTPQTRYSPGACCGVTKQRIEGSPDPKHVSTSHVERQNLTMRMSMRRFTRLTNGFSKKLHNLECAVALHFCHYNFCRIHQTIRVTPAMEAKITDRLWGIEDLLALLDEKAN